ncbi:PREDICTED: sorbitol dehydrogenase-like [Drosophila arizonae]|uniref:Sorbitol dehydrogenase n=1 Tax=Drosophila arizonae TaxID=7263 RepID=A0ABM1PN63_DROAR|nr:PREDICTED: sorbitol dehydrogenase-like [Drosophila arizonae]
MAKDNLTAVLHGIEDMRLEQRPIPNISPEEVLIAMDSVGICGSDVHYLTKGRIGHFVVTKPMVIGHESAGVVAKVGSKVKNLAVGDRVAIEPGVPCYKCDHCKQGSYNLCPDMVFCATPPYDGNLTRYYKHAADFCFKLPDHVTMEEGALLEPLSVGATRSGGVVVIVGMGPPEMKLPLFNALAREVDIRGVFRYCNDYAAALALVASGRVNVKRLVTHHFDIKETQKAFETARSGTGGAIKVMIHVQPRNANNPVKF